MSSPITFSGFNGIDFNVVLSALVQQASQPLTALQSQQAALRSQVTNIGTLSSQVQTVASAVSDLANYDGLSANEATSGAPSALGVSTDGSAVAGHYDVVVNEIARAQVTASASSAPDANTTVVASGGSLVIGGVSVDLTGDTALSGLAAAINDTENIGVSAAVIQASAGAYRLVLTATQTGTANAFTITNSLTGGTGVTFADTNGNGTSGDSAADNAVQATDASLLVNNIAVTSSSNTITDVLPGVTFTAYQKDAATTISVDVAPSSTSLQSKIEAFVTGFNSLSQFLDAQRESAGRNEAASIGREPLVRQLRSSLRSELLGAHGSGTFTRLSEIGIGFSSTGELQLDTARLSEAVATDGEAVRALFASTGGVFATLQTQLEEYTSGSDGFLTAATTRLNDRISRMDSQIANLQSRIALQRESLLREFVAADSIMSRLKNQSGALSGLGSSLGSL